ncbi:actin-related protein 2/3 complex subunit, putative [Phytophthora infestans T30-4]|uniref:Actin-related protein 2/3 complex subunit n=2 Tax=Phytophthora infestans TaxID=4787 RepID=D0P410_PHYIT|nr:actin-related protein 2/3 complex subunit, putative [Phytophthora infestans T30-4]EEY62532.1 actin-related protein 2/3 complex subunit, putative [Phytophthora infestans T30-4]KAF4047164.1 WD domain G-beta repeat [Phytophthora infestans]KAF4139559.1 WD domain G-beta repeat domain-containing protein [Phytophthora infestans]|eukprot:XP_002894962.1 actin-related protein 2/3 complex subunit, putative [Phytophthora infestans T30-4]
MVGGDANLFQLADGISCHAWNKDRSKLAICPNSNEIWIYSGCHAPNPSQWRKEAVLTEHDMLVCGLDWSPVHDQLVSCSHDRSAFVWKYEAAYRQWKPLLVVLRITRAATNVKWSPDGKKFAVSSGAKCVSVCYYQAAENWWVSKIIKKHKSTVTDLDWHPNSQLLVTASTDLKCRVFSAHISDIDGPPDAGPFEALPPFGEPLAEFDNASAWVNAVAWSPKGNRLAFAGQGSSIHIVHFGAPGEYPTIQSIRLSHLPLMRIMFLSNAAIVGVGYDFNPLLFSEDANNFWSFSEFVDKKPTESAVKKNAGGFNAARSLFESKVTRGQSSDATQLDKNMLWMKHESNITCIQPYTKSASGGVTEFSTSALDGRVVLWKLGSLNVELSKLHL